MEGFPKTLVLLPKTTEVPFLGKILHYLDYCHLGAGLYPVDQLGQNCPGAIGNCSRPDSLAQQQTDQQKAQHTSQKLERTDLRSTSSYDARLYLDLRCCD